MLTTPPQPRLTGGSDHEPTPCYEDPWPYDVLMDTTGGAEWHYALKEARANCSRCPIWVQCLRENRDEEWAKAVITGQGRHSPRRSA